MTRSSTMTTYILASSFADFFGGATHMYAMHTYCFSVLEVGAAFMADTADIAL